MVSEGGLNITATVVGDVALKQRFLDLGDSVRGRVRGALLNAGRMIQAAEASLAPRASGALADTIKVKLLEANTLMAITVRPSKFYAQFMEFGVVNHGSRNNKASGGLGPNGKLTKGGKFRRALRVRELRSQGQYRIQPKHFIERAWEATEAAANAGIAKAVSDAVSEAKT